MTCGAKYCPSGCRGCDKWQRIEPAPIVDEELEMVYQARQLIMKPPTDAVMRKFLTPCFGRDTIPEWWIKRANQKELRRILKRRGH